jgi:hypothetical protein
VPVILAMNLHYLLGYVLIALTSLYVVRAFDLPAAPSIAAVLGSAVSILTPLDLWIRERI